MAFIFEVILALCMLTGIYIGIDRLIQSPRTYEYARHLYEQFEANVYDTDIEKSRDD
ncbi:MULTISPECIES: hypothetical protein [Paenibacillus]|uniref:hypothetical protein n=1 Tax=Paenibacillus TaxID=44249 RepID=UPI001FFE7039|nr:hypothetical protein [Paenibacillus pabuli]UPK41509.1 hypothetical protein KET34_19840 [Paenibacillus pabuli]